MRPLLLNTSKSIQIAIFAACTLLSASPTSLLYAEDAKDMPTPAEDSAHLESMDEVLRAEEQKLVEQLSDDDGSMQFAGLMNPNTRFSISPKVPIASTVVRISQLDASRDPSILQLQMELKKQRRSINKLDESLTNLNARTLKVDAALDFAQEEVLQIRTGRMLTSLKADSLHEKVSEIIKEDVIAEMAQEELPPRVQYQLPRRNRRIVTGALSEHPGSALLHGNTVARAVITTQTAPLRSGPATTFNEVFRADLDDIIEIERRYEDWYRVIHSSGVRGWVRAQHILFGETPGDIPGKIIRIRAYDAATDRTDWEPEEG